MRRANVCLKVCDLFDDDDDDDLPLGKKNAKNLSDIYTRIKVGRSGTGTPSNISYCLSV